MYNVFFTTTIFVFVVRPHILYLNFKLSQRSLIAYAKFMQIVVGAAEISPKSMTRMDGNCESAMEKTIALLGVQRKFSIALLENGTFYLISRDHNQPIKRPEFNKVLLYNPRISLTPLYKNRIRVHVSR